MASVFFTLLSIFVFFVLQGTSKINGIFQNKIKVTRNECSNTALGNKEICEKTHHLNFIVVRQHLLCRAPLPSNLTALKPWPSVSEWMKLGNIAYIMSYLESWYVVKDIGCSERHEIAGWNGVKWYSQAYQLSPPPVHILFTYSALTYRWKWLVWL